MFKLTHSLARILGATGRVLWKGSLGARMLAIAGLVVLVIVSSRPGATALTQLAGPGLVLAFLVIVYSLLLRGR